MRLRDALSLLQCQTPEAFYVEYNAAHQYLGEALQRMAPLPPHPPSLRPLLQNLWLGKGATTSPLHYDDYENLLSQVRGLVEAYESGGNTDISVQTDAPVVPAEEYLYQATLAERFGATTFSCASV